MSIETTIADLAAAIRENTEVTRQALASRGTPAPAETTAAPAKETPKPAVKKAAKQAPAEPEPAPALSVVPDADEDLPDPEVDLDDAPEATEEQVRAAYRDAIVDAGDKLPGIKAAYAKAITDAGGLKDGKPYLPNVPAGNHGKLLAQFTAAIA